MKVTFVGKQRAYVSDEAEEIIAVSPNRDGSVSFLLQLSDGRHQSVTLIFDPRWKTWRDEVTEISIPQAA